jgi:hypothetical protein
LGLGIPYSLKYKTIATPESVGNILNIKVDNIMETRVIVIGDRSRNTLNIISS